MTAPIPYSAWKAEALNQLFQTQGATGKPGRLTAATVRHGDPGSIGGRPLIFTTHSKPGPAPGAGILKEGSPS